LEVKSDHDAEGVADAIALPRDVMVLILLFFDLAALDLLDLLLGVLRLFSLFTLLNEIVPLNFVGGR
jgi:hypothetical protein